MCAPGDAGARRRASVLESAAVDKRTFEGEAVSRVDVGIPSDVPPLREKLHAAGIETFEADVRFASRYLIERGIKGGCEIDGRSSARRHGMACVSSTTRSLPRPTSARASSVCRSISRRTRRASACSRYRLYGLGVDEVLIVDATDRPMPEHAERCSTETAALEAFGARVGRSTRTC